MSIKAIHASQLAFTEGLRNQWKDIPRADSLGKSVV
jgi:hypothetical protein